MNKKTIGISTLLVLTMISVAFAATVTAPTVKSISAKNITDTSADIAFTVNQKSADTVVNYGIYGIGNIGIQSDWNNNTVATRTITLSSLSNGTKYSYSIHACNGNSPSICSDSVAKSFVTKSSVPNSTIAATVPNINNVNYSVTNTSAQITFDVDQNDADTIINYGTKSKSLVMQSGWDNNSGTSRAITLANLTNTTKYYFNIYAYNGTDQSKSSNFGILSFTTLTDNTSGPVGTGSPNSLNITSTSPGQVVNTTANEPVNFTVSFDQIVNVIWYLNGINIKTDNTVTSSFDSNVTSTAGTYNLTVVGENKNGTVSYIWSLTIEPQTFVTGNRIWDATKGMSTTYTWNAQSFSGFYYDLDSNISTENLVMTNIARTINQGDITYNTAPIEVNFQYPGFGSYQVVGFMADKYFAGYDANTTPPGPSTPISAVSTMANGQLQKVLIDDENKYTISVGGTLVLQEGYVLKATDIDLTARTMLLTLLKDGTEVDSAPLSENQTYVYAKTVGNVQNVPIIMVRFDSVFSGTEVQAAFIKGLFQISENPTSVQTGNTFGLMDVTSVSANGISMDNQNNVIGLSPGTNVSIMGNISFRVADSTDVRFYPYVSVSPAITTGNQLIVNSPSSATAGDTININVTAGGAPVQGASIDIEPDIGTVNNTTDNNGSINFTFPLTSKGIYNITASKLGYQSANGTINIAEYIAGRLVIDVPSTADQFTAIPIHITSNGSDIANATISFDNESIGSTDNNGVLNYTLESSGEHTISASKTDYIATSINISVRAPYSDFEAQDINIIPNSTYSGENIMVVSNITNAGTKGDTKIIDLTVNGTNVSNMSVTIDKKQTEEINFTYRISLPKGNYTVEILGQKGIVEVKEQPYNIILITALITLIGAVGIYIATMKKDKMETYKQLFKKNIKMSIRRNS